MVYKWFTKIGDTPKYGGSIQLRGVATIRDLFFPFHHSAYDSGI